MITFPASVQHANPYPYGPPVPDLQMNLEALGKLFAAVQEIKKRRTEDSILAQISQAQSPEQVKSQLAELYNERTAPAEGVLGTIGRGLETFNPFAKYRGMTDVDRNIHRNTLQESFRGKEEPKKEKQPSVKQNETLRNKLEERLLKEDNPDIETQIQKRIDEIDERITKQYDTITGTTELRKEVAAKKKAAENKKRYEVTRKQIKKGIDPAKIDVKGLSPTQIDILKNYWLILHGDKN